MKVTAPKRVKAGKRPKVKVVLTAKGGDKVTGDVRFRYAGKQVTKRVTNNTVQQRLAKLTRNTKVRVIYVGNDTFDRVKKSVVIKVRSKK